MGADFGVARPALHGWIERILVLRARGSPAGFFVSANFEGEFSERSQTYAGKASR
jgi:hypothetical protein